MVELSPSDKQRIAARTSAILARLPSHAGRWPERAEALALLFAHTQSPALRSHMLAVEAAMAAWARRTGEDELPYRLAGLLHDLDYEQHPHPVDHPFVGCELFLDRGYPRELVEAVLGHAGYTGVPRRTPLARTLFAVDELTGFLTAVAYVRPEGLQGLTFKSFQKKFKTPSFAAGVNRDEVRQGSEELGVPLEEHVLFLADALVLAFPRFPEIAEASGDGPK